MPRRTYLIEPADETVKLPVRLVKATHPGTAMAHVAQQLFKVRVASQDDLEALLSQGAKVETIRAEQTELPTT